MRPTPLRSLALAAALLASWPARAEPDLDVVVTSKPIHSLVAGVMAGIATPRLLISSSQSPHTYALKPSDAAAAAHATVVFRISDVIEPFTTRLFASLPTAVRRISLAESPGMTHLPLRTGARFPDHTHDRAHAHEHTRSHDNSATAPHVSADHADHADDGHVWLDPDNARAMVTEIARVLGAIAPGHAERLAANATSLSRRLADLDRALQAELSPVRGRPFVVFHDAIQYFERHFGVTAVAAIVTHPDAAPSARRLADVRARVRDAGATCVFAEPQVSRRLVDAVREGTSARLGLIDPEGSALAPGPELYFALMRGLAKSIAGCLAGS